MSIFGLFWVASWFGSFSSLTEKVLEAPRYLSHILFSQPSSTPHDSSSESEFLSQNVPLSAVEQPNSRFSFIRDRVSQPTSSTVWSSAIETLLSTPVSPPTRYSLSLSQNSNDYSIALNEAAASHSTGSPLDYLMGVVQNFFWTVPHDIAATDFANLVSPVVVIQSSSDHQTAQVGLRDGYWKCATWRERPPSQSSLGSFQVWVKGCLVAEVTDQFSADRVAESLNRLLKTPNLDAAQLTPAFEKDLPTIKLGDRVVFKFDRDLAGQFDRPAELVAIDWVNNLRIALGHNPLSMADAQVKMHSLQDTGSSIGGLASWYGPYFHGRQTATGEIFDQNDLTAAHPSLPFGTFLKVTNLLNGKSVVVRVNDRGPYFDNRILDLSNRAARCIGSEDKGVVPIEAEIMLPTTVFRASSNREMARL